MRICGFTAKQARLAAAHGLNEALARRGLELSRRGWRLSTESALQRLRDRGLEVRTVIDVGAARGEWARTCAGIFPEARIILLEPLLEFEVELRGAVDRTDTVIELSAAGSEPGESVLHVHDDLFGSSLLTEAEGTSADGTPRCVPVVRVDDVVERAGAEGPYLLKADVQGSELDVIGGAERVLATAEAVLLEVSFRRFLQGGPIFEEVTAAMGELGFQIDDVFNLLYRPLDGALAQADVVYLPRTSSLLRSDLWGDA